MANKNEQMINDNFLHFHPLIVYDVVLNTFFCQLNLKFNFSTKSTKTEVCYSGWL